MQFLRDGVQTVETGLIVQGNEFFAVGSCPVDPASNHHTHFVMFLVMLHQSVI